MLVPKPWQKIVLHIKKKTIELAEGQHHNLWFSNCFVRPKAKVFGVVNVFQKEDELSRGFLVQQQHLIQSTSGATPHVEKFCVASSINGAAGSGWNWLILSFEKDVANDEINKNHCSSIVLRDARGQAAYLSFWHSKRDIYQHYRAPHGDTWFLKCI